MSEAAPSALRLGCVKYLNARPLIHGWPGSVVFDHPSALCVQLERGELDVALVSSFELFLRPEFLVVDQIAIASDGPVYSVIVASEKALEQIRTIALDPGSVTSVNLLRCLLEERELRAQFVSNEPADAQLLIGDQALRYRARSKTSQQIIDVGQWWKSATALPFVYALWLIRPDYASAHEIAARLRHLRDHNMKRLNTLAVEQNEFGSKFCQRYWRENLRFNFGDREKAGLLKFRSLCEKHGLLPSPGPPLNLI